MPHMETVCLLNLQWKSKFCTCQSFLLMMLKFLVSEYEVWKSTRDTQMYRGVKKRKEYETVTPHRTYLPQRENKNQKSAHQNTKKVILKQ